MISTIKGLLMGVATKVPENGQEFKPHLLLSIIQRKEGEVDTIKVKDFDLNAKYEVDKPLTMDVFSNFWQNKGRSGLSITVVT